MLTKLEMELKADKAEDINFQKAVLLQSIMLERTRPEYAEKMHLSELHPYSQAIVRENGKNIWVVNALNKEAYEELISPLEKNDFKEFHLNHNDLEVEVISKEKMQKKKTSLMEEFYLNNGDKYINIRFRTPTSFKSDGKYIFYPDIYLIYRSLLTKYEAASIDETTYSDELLEQLATSTFITRYNLKSYKFNIGKGAVPSFIGNITLRVNGPQSMINFANLLFEFGEYSGIGIKTAMGMGNIELLKGEK